jgi:hypothetical protein
MAASQVCIPVFGLTPQQPGRAAQAPQRHAQLVQGLGVCHRRRRVRWLQTLRQVGQQLLQHVGHQRLQRLLRRHRRLQATARAGRGLGIGAFAAWQPGPQVQAECKALDPAAGELDQCGGLAIHQQELQPRFRCPRAVGARLDRLQRDLDQAAADPDLAWCCLGESPAGHG